MAIDLRTIELGRILIEFHGDMTKLRRDSDAEHKQAVRLVMAMNDIQNLFENPNTDTPCMQLLPSAQG